MRIVDVLLVVGVAVAPPGPADDGQRVREQRLASIRAEAVRIEARLEAVRGRVSTLAGEVETLGLELALSEERIAASQAAGELAASRLEAAEQRAGILEADLVRLRARLERSVFALHRLGRQGYLRLVSTVAREADPLPAIRWLRFLGRRDAGAFRARRAAAAALEEERREIATQRDAVTRALADEERRRRESAALYRRQRALLASAETEGRRLGERASGLRDSERRLATLLDLVASGATDLAGRPIQDFRGVLDWPAAGAVVAGFGPRLDPRYRTQVPHPGVDIAATAGAPVRAVYAGRVAYAGVFEDYGRMVVVRHPNRAFTLYAGLASLKVSKDDAIALSALLGEAAATPLYFEVRVDAHAEDPSRWLRERDDPPRAERR